MAIALVLVLTAVALGSLLVIALTLRGSTAIDAVPTPAPGANGVTGLVPGAWVAGARSALFFSLLPFLLHGARYIVLVNELPSPQWFMFLPMGVPAACILGWLRLTSSGRFHAAITGYLVALPIAMLGSLLSGLVHIGAGYVTLYGAPPLVIGVIVGALAGWHIPGWKSH
jgi:hypothetical protein